MVQVFKDITSTASKLEDIERTLASSIERFSRYFASGKNVSDSVQSALVKYYEIVIGFAVETHGEFQASRTRKAQLRHAESLAYIYRFCVQCRTSNFEHKAY